MKLIITESQYRILVESPIKWTPETITPEALKYNTKAEFKKGNNNAYRAAIRNGMINDLFDNQLIYWTPEMISVEAKKYKNAGDFKKGSNSAYAIASNRKMLKNLFPDSFNEIIQWTPEMISQESKKYNTKKEFNVGNHLAYAAAWRKKMLNDLYPNDVSNIMWTPEMISKEAKKYETKSDFQMGNVNAYNAAVYRKMTDDLFPFSDKNEPLGENRLKNILIEMGFKNVKSQYKIENCKGSITCYPYKFDVFLPYNKNNYMINKNIPKTGVIFEFDGQGHFYPVKQWGGEKGLMSTIFRDNEKNLYCQNNNIKLIRIPYTSLKKEIMKQQIDSSLNNKNTFILTGDYPQLGWNQK